MNSYSSSSISPIKKGSSNERRLTSNALQLLPSLQPYIPPHSFNARQWLHKRRLPPNSDKKITTAPT